MERTEKETKNELDYTDQSNWYCHFISTFNLSIHFISDTVNRIRFGNDDILILYHARGFELIDIILGDCLDIMKDMSDDSVLDSSAYRLCL